MAHLGYYHMEHFGEELSWDLLYEISHQTFDFVLQWLGRFGFTSEDYDFGDGVELEDIAEEDRATFDGALFLGGYWSDEQPVIEFEDGHVVRWYRSESWD